MKRLFLISAISLTGCASMMAPHDPQTLVAKQPRIYQPVGANAYQFRNKDIEINYVPDIEGAGVAFEFKNLSKSAIKVIWDESSFLDAAGESVRIFHQGVQIATRDKPQTPSMIPAGARITDELIPISSPYFDTAGYASWQYLPLCGTSSYLTHELDATACEGRTLGYFITYEIGGKKKTAEVKFKYVSLDKTKKQAAN